MRRSASPCLPRTKCKMRHTKATTVLVLAERRCADEDFDALSQKLIGGVNGTTDRRKVGIETTGLNDGVHLRRDYCAK